MLSWEKVTPEMGPVSVVTCQEVTVRKVGKEHVFRARNCCHPVQGVVMEGHGGAVTGEADVELYPLSAVSRWEQKGGEDSAVRKGTEEKDIQ